MIAWYIVPYKYLVRNSGLKNSRYLAIDDFTPQIRADAGDWSEIEIDGAGANGIGQALVKVRAEPTTLALLNTNFQRVTGNPRAQVTATRPTPRYDEATNEIKLDAGPRKLGQRFETVHNKVK